MSMRASLTTGAALIVMSLLGAAPGLAQDPRRGGDRFGDMMRRIPVMRVLDADEDGAISAAERAGATKAILTLDQDGDGNLTREELAPEDPEPDRRGPGGPPDGRGGPPDGRGGPPEGRGGRGGRGGLPGGPGGPGGMMGMVPVMVALDKDRDGELFEDEVTDAAQSLATLDQDGDGRLAGDELMPDFRGFRRGGRGGPGGRGGFGGGRDGDTLAPDQVGPEDGAAELPDRAAFRALSYQGEEVMIDTHLVGLEFVKFQIEGAGTEQPRLYFINTKTHRAHMMFMSAVGLPRRGEGQMRGVLIYWPMLKSPAGKPGLFTFEFEPNDAFPYEMIQIAHDLLDRHSALVRGNLAYNLLPYAKETYLTETEKYAEAGLPVFETKDQYADIAFLPLHRGETFGRLRLMKPNERPGPRDVVLYPTLPNEMPRVAGVITAVRQTPLSHVNLRAIQDDVPNAFIDGAVENGIIAALVGKYVHYVVSSDGFTIREATVEDVESHFSALRPSEKQVPPRDLSLTEIRPLAELGFEDAARVGVKAANLAALRKLGLRGDLIPDGFAVPFSFYDGFMKQNGFYAMAEKMIAAPDFQQDAGAREKALEGLRKAIEKGAMPEAMAQALDAVQARFPEGTSIRCRSSTNNEDLPGFSGAGLYDSFTHRPDEGRLAKSIAQVYASLWNFRAFEEREFYRIDHAAAAMGVLLHPNTTGEVANGVAVTQDVLYQSEGQVGRRFYVNAQVGEDLVTNPEAGSTPEELLLSPRNPRTDRVIRHSSRRAAGAALLGADHLRELRRALRVIHERFQELYHAAEDPGFAMEIEFKVTSEGALLIKQARPWVHD